MVFGPAIAAASAAAVARARKAEVAEAVIVVVPDSVVAKGAGTPGGEARGAIC